MYSYALVYDGISYGVVYGYNLKNINSGNI